MFWIIVVCGALLLLVVAVLVLHPPQVEVVERKLCPRCRLVVQDSQPAAWSEFYEAFVHEWCCPTTVSTRGNQAVKHWLATGEENGP